MNTDSPLKKRIITSKVPAGIKETDLLGYLAGRFSYLNAQQWSDEIVLGKVLLNGVLPEDTVTVKEGDSISWDGRDIVEPAVDGNYTILYRDEFFLAVDKPGDLPVHPAGRYFNNTLTMMLEHSLGRKVYPVHRIDRETSGIILIALDPDSAAKLSTALAYGRKEYTAIVRGAFPAEPVIIDMPLGPDIHSPVRKKRAAYAGAPEDARTELSLVQTFGSFSLIRAVPDTGRLHQIRAHCEYAGFPLVGDKIYGGNPEWFIRFIENGLTGDLVAELLLPRCALHASSLSFRHPVEKKELSINAPLPLLFTEFIAKEMNRG